MGKDTLTVAQLIELLKTFDPDKPVILQGCDCWGACVGARDDLTGNKNEIVLLTRFDGAV